VVATRSEYPLGPCRPPAPSVTAERAQCAAAATALPSTTSGCSGSEPHGAHAPEGSRPGPRTRALHTAAPGAGSERVGVC